MIYAIGEGVKKTDATLPGENEETEKKSLFDIELWKNSGRIGGQTCLSENFAVTA